MTKPLQLNSSKDPSFKKFLNSKTKDNKLTGSVNRFLLAKPRDTSRATDVLHPSEIVRADWCHRASYYLLNGATASSDPIDLKKHLTFQMGHLIHDLWQSLFADMGILYGTWICQQCGYYCKKITNEPACPLHGLDTKWRYAEVPVSNSELRISGRSDGIITRNSDTYLLEIKSMSKGTFLFEDRDLWFESGQNYEKAWSAFSSPFEKHVMQAQLYMKLLEGQEIAPEKALLLYHSKPDNEIKEFIVPKSDFGIGPLFDSAKKILDAIANETPLSCNIKPSTGCNKCKDY